MAKKVIKLVDRQKCMGRTTRELRKVLRQIDSGEVIGMCFSVIKRDGNAFAYYDVDCAIRALGAADLLKDYIRQKSFYAK